MTLVLYDGVCGLCNRFVSFLIRHDDRDQLRFATLQSNFARTLLARHRVTSADSQSVLVLAHFQSPDELLLTRSDAAIQAVSLLGGMWKLAVVFRVLPRILRDAVYEFVARHRYQVFGKYDTCPAPSQGSTKFFSDET